MGYCINLTDYKFGILKDNKEKALQAIKELMGRVDELGSGGRWEVGEKVKSNFAWVWTGDVLASCSFEGAMECWRYPVESDDNGDIADIQFDGEKLGQEGLMFQAIAPYVVAGSYLQFQGEDGSIWRFVFDGEKMIDKAATISFE